MDCIFCKIATGEFDCAKVFEDDNVLAFLDVNPLTKGHCLVIPKAHFENIFDIDENILQKITVVAKKISEKVKGNLQAAGIRLSQSNGRAAHQEVMHFHLHIIPRYEDDGLEMDNHGKAQPPRVEMEELKKLAEELKK